MCDDCLIEKTHKEMLEILKSMDNKLTVDLPTVYGTEKQERWDRRFIELAKLVSTWSKDPSSKVGLLMTRTELCPSASMGFLWV